MAILYHTRVGRDPGWLIYIFLVSSTAFMAVLYHTSVDIRETFVDVRGTSADIC